MAVKNKISETKIDSLIPDSLNANKGTEYGQHLIEKSVREFGFGRSILLDKNNKIIAGNKATENAGAVGIDDVIIIESDGTKIIAVKRTDIDLDSEQGRSLALADNATAKANISWDHEVIEKIEQEWDIKAEDWGIAEYEEPVSPPEGSGPTEARLIVQCSDVSKLSELFTELQARGFNCELKE